MQILTLDLPSISGYIWEEVLNLDIVSKRCHFLATLELYVRHFRTSNIKKTKCSPVPKLRAELSSPREARAFHELRRYHTRPLRFNWGPKNVHFGKTHFRDPNINVKIFFVENL